MKAFFGDNEHFNALGARWPHFSQTKVHHQQLARLLHGEGDKPLAYRLVRQRVLDGRVANAITVMREVDAQKERDALDRKAFKQLQQQDRKLLYKQYGFSDSEEEDSASEHSAAKGEKPPS
jgi:hypothetical protein